MIEFRRENNELKIEGVVVTYNEITSRTVFGKEKILPRSFGNLTTADVVLNKQHDRSKPIARTGKGGLTLIDSPLELRAKAILPDTAEARDTVKLIEDEVLQGFSVEMIVLQERQESAVRVIEKASLVGIAVVDRPAYKLSRARKKRSIPLWVY